MPALHPAMKKFLLVLLVLAAAPVLRAAPTPDPAEEQIKAVMKQFLGDPGADSAMGLARQIMDYAEKTEAHEVTIDARCLPWMGQKEQPPEDASALLLTSFVAGDILEQMRKGTSKPESYAGVLTMLSAYEKLRLKNPDLRIDSIKQYVELERMGQLKAHIEQVEKASPSPSPAK